MTTAFALPADQHLMTERDAASFLNVSTRTLQAWRVSGCGPIYRRVGPRRLGYMRSDLLGHLNARQYANTSTEDLARAARELKKG